MAVTELCCLCCPRPAARWGKLQLGSHRQTWCTGLWLPSRSLPHVAAGRGQHRQQSCPIAALTDGLSCGLDMPAVTHVDVCLATLGNTARHMTQAGLSPSACTRA